MACRSRSLLIPVRPNRASSGRPDRTDYLHVFAPRRPLQLLEQHWLLDVQDVPTARQQSRSLPEVHVGPQQLSARPHAGQVNTQPVAGSQLSVVQVMPSLHVIAVC